MILSNSINFIFGRKLKKPDDKFFTQFKINYNVYFKNPLNKNLLSNKGNEIDDKKFFEEFYKTFNKKKCKKKPKNKNYF